LTRAIADLVATYRQSSAGEPPVASGRHFSDLGHTVGTPSLAPAVQDPELAAVVEAWLGLPPPIRRIVADLVEECRKPVAEGSAPQREGGERR